MTDETTNNEDLDRRDKGENYGPYGQRRPGQRPDVDKDDVSDDKREEAWQPARD